MLDVHPPHSPTHTWKDFFIHIATIVVGLLIAVGLEQTVEYVHHAHQRGELLEDLQREAEYNLAACEGNLPYFDQHLGWLLKVKLAVDQYRVDRSGPSTLPTEPPLAKGAFKDRAYQFATRTSAKYLRSSCFALARAVSPVLPHQLRVPSGFFRFGVWCAISYDSTDGPELYS